MVSSNTPVITIDGPTASGKGTVASRVAQQLGWHVLDSGALYRLTALACEQNMIDSDEESAVAQQAQALDVHFSAGRSYLNQVDVTDALRQEHIGLLASKIAAYPAVREALLARQRAFQTGKGLVADGRDMGTVVFPDAPLKIFLVADVQSRAQRRYKQLIDKGISANLSDLLVDLQARDLRDMNRAVAPLKPAQDAYILDSSSLSIDETVNQVLQYWANAQSTFRCR